MEKTSKELTKKERKICKKLFKVTDYITKNTSNIEIESQIKLLSKIKEIITIIIYQ